MSTIPVSVPVWDSTLTHVVAITGGHASTGFGNNEVPGSGEMNTVFNLAGQWCQYVNDGVWSQAIHLTSTLIVDGTVTFSGNLGVTGTITPGHISHTELWTASVPTVGGVASNVVEHRGFIGVSTVAGAYNWDSPAFDGTMRAGDRIRSVTAFCSAGGGTLDVRFFSYLTQTDASVAVAPQSSAASGDVTVDCTGSSHPITQFGFYFLRWSGTGTNGGNDGTITSELIYSIRVNYDHP